MAPLLGGSTFGNEHKFADRFLIPEIETQIRAANPAASARQVTTEAGRQARWVMTGEPGPAAVIPEPTVPHPPSTPRGGGGVSAGGVVTGVLWAVNIYFAWDAYEMGSEPNTPAPVGNGMIGGSRGEAIMNAMGVLAGGLPAGTMMRQGAEFASTGSDPSKVWNAITSGTASPTSIGMGIFFGAFR